MSRSRPSSLAPLEGLLLGLRAGEASYDDLARAASPVLEVRSKRVLRMWSTSGHAQHLTVDDLVQEQLLCLWRSVATWDPARGPSIVRYVDAELGRAARAVLRQVCGYPDPRRSAPARRVEGSHLVPARGVYEDHWLEWVRDERCVDPEELVARREAAAAFADERDLRGFDREVVQLVVNGASLPEAGRKIYADPAKRIRYRLDSCELAERSAELAALRVAASVGA